MKLLVDMNLSPRFCSILQAEGWHTVHWSQVGNVTAPDSDIMQWARNEHRVVITHDLDFGAILAITHAAGPSVVQVRTQDVRPKILGPLLVSLLRQYETELDAGSLLSVDQMRARVRLLPLSKS